MPARIVALAAVLLLAGTTATAPAAQPKKLDGNAVIGFGGVGPVKLGMTIAGSPSARIGGSSRSPRGGARRSTSARAAPERG